MVLIGRNWDSSDSMDSTDRSESIDRSDSSYSSDSSNISCKSDSSNSSNSSDIIDKSDCTDIIIVLSSKQIPFKELNFLKITVVVLFWNLVVLITQKNHPKVSLKFIHPSASKFVKLEDTSS